MYVPVLNSLIPDSNLYKHGILVAYSMVEIDLMRWFSIDWSRHHYRSAARELGYVKKFRITSGSLQYQT